jgi:hypothetical protein
VDFRDGRREFQGADDRMFASALTEHQKSHIKVLSQEPPAVN